MGLAIILLVIGAVALILYYTAIPEPLVRVIGIAALVIGLVILLVAVFDSDGVDTARSSWSLIATVARSSWS